MLFDRVICEPGDREEQRDGARRRWESLESGDQSPLPPVYPVTRLYCLHSHGGPGLRPGAATSGSELGGAWSLAAGDC